MAGLHARHFGGDQVRRLGLGCGDGRLDAFGRLRRDLAWRHAELFGDAVDDGGADIGGLAAKKTLQHRFDQRRADLARRLDEDRADQRIHQASPIASISAR